MWGLGTTLIVDDSDVYRRLLCMLLEPFSEKVLDAANPAAAIALIDA
jgi:CheY-like chemotaxis protein